jgi:hypothetical protein
LIRIYIILIRIKIILELNYTTIANFRRLSDIVEHNAEHNSISNELFRQIDDELIKQAHTDDYNYLVLWFSYERIDVNNVGRKTE